MSIFLIILFLIIAAAVALKLYLKLRIRDNGSYMCLVGKTAIVTGANAGIGYITALDFAKRGARVILACRNKDRAEEALNKILIATQNPNVVYKLVDFTSLESVRAFAKDINETEERVDILVNNAGAGGLGNHFTNDGIQITLQVNHIAGFLLTHLLLDKIKKSAPSRIVNVSSVLARYSRLAIRTINEYPINVPLVIGDFHMYCSSKLCNILFTIQLAKKLSNTGVTVNALHPGAVKTNIFRRLKGLSKIAFNAAINLYFKTAEEGAQTTIYLSTSENVKGVTGNLFDNCRRIEIYKTAKDVVLAQKVWEKSEELAKLAPNEKIKCN